MHVSHQACGPFSQQPALYLLLLYPACCKLDKEVAVQRRLGVCVAVFALPGGCDLSCKLDLQQ